MTDTEALELVIAAIDPEGGNLTLINKNGRVLLALPANRQAAMRTLRLYQPQRAAAKAFIRGLELAVRSGLHHAILRTKVTLKPVRLELNPALPEVIPGSLGIMLGSPEHRVRRAIATVQTHNGLEVAKIAFGKGGHEVITGEAAALESLPSGIQAVPKVFGTHHGDGISMMRMAYFQGSVLAAGDNADAIALLDSWISSEPAIAIHEFPEWSAIALALANAGGSKALESLKGFKLVPSIRHGDFARWNLLRTADGSLMVLDWEWGAARGMPGIDLVHYFAQDARLVERLSPAEILNSVERSLQKSACRKQLEKTGWGESVRAAILASVAYTVGANQQANEEVLKAAIAAFLSDASISR
jgi:hypothetical protein